MINVQSAVNAPVDAQPEAGVERTQTVRRPFILCARHIEERRDWINMPEGEERREAHLQLFRAVAFCPECQELTWSSGQNPPQPPPQPQPETQPQDTYSWWRDVMGQP